MQKTNVQGGDSMPLADINYTAVLAAAVAAMVIGTVYYAKPVLGRTWMRLAKRNEQEMKKGAGAAYAWMAVAAIVQALILSYFVDYTDAITASQGAATGFWVWLGFAAPVLLADSLFEGKPKRLWLLQSGYHVLALLAMGAILAAWV